MRFPLTDPVRLLDIGARYGLQQPWAEYADSCQPVLFEPEAEEYARLKARYADVHNVALSDTEGARTLYVSKGAGKSSLYETNLPLLELFPKPERFRIVEKQTVTTTTLDSLYRNGRLTDADAIKVDVQGAELDILRGGERLIADHVLTLQIEICFGELYVGHARFADIDAFVSRIGGIHIHDLSKHHWRYARGEHLDAKGRLMFGDALYFSDIERIMAMKDPEAKLLKAAFIAMIYGFPDFSLHLLHESRLTTQRVAAAQNFINKRCKQKLTFPSAAIRRELKLLLAAFPSDGRDGSVGARKRFGRLVW